jgi:hypothetical protein
MAEAAPDQVMRDEWLVMAAKWQQMADTVDQHF